MKKRHLSFALAIVFLLICTSTAFADETPKIYGDKIQCKSGDTVEFSVNISENPGIVGCLVSAVCEDDWLYFDETVTQGNFTDLGTITSSYDIRMLNVAWFNNDDVTGDGTLYTFTVHVSPSAPSGDYPIQIFVSQENTINGAYEEVEFEPVDGCISVENVPFDNAEYDAANNGGISKTAVWIICGAVSLTVIVAATFFVIRKRNNNK